VPLAVWILEGFMRGVPKEIDETAYIDGYSFPRFFVKIFMPLIASGIGVAAFFCFMFSWVELLLPDAHLGERQAHRRHHDPHGFGLGTRLGGAGRGGRADHHARRARDLLRPQLHRQGLRPGPGLRRTASWPAMDGVDVAHRDLLHGDRDAARHLHGPRDQVPGNAAPGNPRIDTTRGDRLFITLLGSAFINLAWLGICRREPALRCADPLPVLRRAVFRWV
jgi:hypothetical protein